MSAARRSSILATRIEAAEHPHPTKSCMQQNLYHKLTNHHHKRQAAAP
uniref:Uncharacterized protein n=1 Tax=Arundo donax TaxID=35708 RepID=A0A0A9H2M2_ARUDO